MGLARKAWKLLADAPGVVQSLAFIVLCLNTLNLKAFNPQQLLLFVSITLEVLLAVVLIGMIFQSRSKKQTSILEEPKQAKEIPQLWGRKKVGPVSQGDVEGALPSVEEAQRSYEEVINRIKQDDPDAYVVGTSLIVDISNTMVHSISYQVVAYTKSRQLYIRAHLLDYRFLGSRSIDVKYSKPGKHDSYAGAKTTKPFTDVYPKWRELTLHTFNRFRHEVAGSINIHLSGYAAKPGRPGSLAVYFSFDVNGLHQRKSVEASKAQSNNFRKSLLEIEDN